MGLENLTQNMPADQVEPTQPERLIPIPIGGKPKEFLEAEEKGVDRQELAEIRREALRLAPDLDDLIRKERKKQKIETPETINLALEAVENFQRTAREAQDFRRVIRTAQDPDEKQQALSVYNEKKQELAKYLSYGLSFEKAYREYLRSRSRYINFATTLGEIGRLEGLLEEPSFKSIGETAVFDSRAFARIEEVMRETEPHEVQSKKEQKELLASLATVYPEGSPEYNEAKELLTARRKNLPYTKKELGDRLVQVRQEVSDLWQDPMVRYFWQRAEIDTMLADFAEGKDVIETQSVIKYLNELHDWENHHTRTTIGGILVGPPGVGKTTLVRHYLSEKDRNYVYIDLSEDVTRYLLYGSKAIEFRTQTEYHKALVDNLSSLSNEDFIQFVRQNAKTLKEVVHIGDDEAIAGVIDMIDSELSEVSAEVSTKKVDELKSRLTGIAKSAFYEELSTEFAHMIQRNGWRDGVIIAALRRGDSIIFDEFNKNKNWSLIYGLITAKPGESWYFADNDEHIAVPQNWRMYFTGNIGRKHGGFEVAEALASRAGGKVMEIGYPSPKEEMYIALTTLANPEGDFLRSKDDLAKAFVKVNELFPRIRTFIEDRRQAIPVSYRTIRDMGEKLVTYRDPKTRKPVFAPTSKSFDEALYEVLVESYGLYEDKTTPREIVNMATQVGLMLDDSVRDRIIGAGYLDEEELNKRKETFEQHKEDFADIVNKIRGLTRDVSTLTFPEQRSF